MELNKQLTQEEIEAKILAEEGFYFETPKVFSPFARNKKRRWHVRPVFYGAMKKANRHALAIKMTTNDNDVASTIQNMTETITPLHNYLAIFVLGNPLLIFLFRPLLAWYLSWHLQPKDTAEINLQILKMYDLGNFMNSIRLIGTITSPNAEATAEVPTMPNPIGG